MSAAELMEELAKACRGDVGGHQVSLIVHGPGMILLRVRTRGSDRHVVLKVNVEKMTREQFAQVIADGRKVLEGRGGEG